ncbi:hypothetical protein J6S88_02385, partial [bacterium]|nr:hypothetical protein [bacterium]
TYWDTIGSLIPDSEVPAAAIIRAWYEEKGLDASAGVEGIEGCSVFPIMEDIAEKLKNAIDNYISDYNGPGGGSSINFDDYGIKELKEEFFNVFLGSGNSANSWSNPNKIVIADDYRVRSTRKLLDTIDGIMEGIDNLKFDNLTSTEFTTNSSVTTPYIRSLVTDGYDNNPNNNQNISRTDVLSGIVADILSSGVIDNNSTPTHDLCIGFYNYTVSGAGMQGYGDINTFNNDLLLEFVYPVAIDFFNTHGMPVYGYMKQDSAGHWEDATAEAEWYTNLFNKVEQCGYKTLERGLASSQDWIRFALENGIGIIEQLNTVDTWNKITYNSCSDITEETNSQKATLAEAEYNKAMNQIQAKDERLDLELKNIDTEHSALQKEYESVQKAMTDNVSRTFKMFS